MSYETCFDGVGLAECLNANLIKSLQREEDLTVDMNTLFVLIGACLLFFMQIGFAFVEVGSVQMKNQKNILSNNVLDVSLGVIAWYLIGYGIAYGYDDYIVDGKENGFIGTNGYFLAGDSFRDDDVSDSQMGFKWANWVYQWGFAASCTAIISGAVMERISTSCYILYAMCMTGFIYPIMVHMTWSEGGWMSVFREENLLSECGVVDFAGSGVIHMTGGIAALIGAIMVGPRIGRFGPNGEILKLPQLSSVYQTVGTLALWFGSYGFNAMSCLYLIGNGYATARVMINSTLSGAIAGACSTLFALVNDGYINSAATNNGILSGFVAVASVSGIVQPEGAIVIGCIAGIIYQLSSRLLLKLRIDDSINASPVHLFSGAWGMIATGLFAEETNYGKAYYPGRQDSCCGVFYGCGGSQLAAQIVFILVNLAWTSFTCIAVLVIAKFTIGLRVSDEIEEIGIDSSKHGGIVDYFIEPKGYDGSIAVGSADLQEKEANMNIKEKV
mmetsp:Transcript_5652/g.8495  ORF Transcript_5652/g.8495 Transcript_5652/m.8495 type:complete len:500 (+) Transcript_5652:39-1538(+)